MLKTTEDKARLARQVLATVPASDVAGSLLISKLPVDERDGLVRAMLHFANLVIQAQNIRPAGPLRIDWNKFDLAEAYDLVEGVRRQSSQSTESDIDIGLRAALDAIEAADCAWDGMTAVC